MMSGPVRDGGMDRKVSPQPITVLRRKKPGPKARGQLSPQVPLWHAKARIWLYVLRKILVYPKRAGGGARSW